VVLVVVIQVQLLEPQVHLDKVLRVVEKFLQMATKAVAVAVLALLVAMPLQVQVITEVLVVVAVLALAQPSQAKEFFMLAEAVVALTIPPQELV
jgi:hypothetical protein